MALALPPLLLVAACFGGPHPGAGGASDAIVVGDGERCGPEIAECDDDSYCALGVCDALEGVCAARTPDRHATPSDPVCGCDGVTYGSDQEAQAHGVNVRAPNACPSDPRATPCDLLRCDDGEVCMLLGDGTTGVGCVPDPGPCAQDVCGDDGRFECLQERDDSVDPPGWTYECVRSAERPS